MAHLDPFVIVLTMPEGIPELLVVVATFLVFGLLVVAGIIFQTTSRSR